jgi:hypothetical protein
MGKVIRPDAFKQLPSEDVVKAALMPGFDIIQKAMDLLRRRVDAAMIRGLCRHRRLPELGPINLTLDMMKGVTVESGPEWENYFDKGVWFFSHSLMQHQTIQDGDKEPRIVLWCNVKYPPDKFDKVTVETKGATRNGNVPV